MEEIDKIKSEANKEYSLSKNKVVNIDVLENLDSTENWGVPKKPNVPKEVNFVVDLINNNLVQGFIMSEILGSPKAKKSRGNTIWNSRF